MPVVWLCVEIRYGPLVPRPHANRIHAVRSEVKWPLKARIYSPCALNISSLRCAVVMNPALVAPNVHCIIIQLTLLQFTIETIYLQYLESLWSLKKSISWQSTVFQSGTSTLGTTHPFFRNRPQVARQYRYAWCSASITRAKK